MDWIWNDSTQKTVLSSCANKVSSFTGSPLIRTPILPKNLQVHLWTRGCSWMLMFCRMRFHRPNYILLTCAAFMSRAFWYASDHIAICMQVLAHSEITVSSKRYRDRHLSQ